jgi:hypothetical protein
VTGWPRDTAVVVQLSGVLGFFLAYYVTDVCYLPLNVVNELMSEHIHHLPLLVAEW